MLNHANLCQPIDCYQRLPFIGLGGRVLPFLGLNISTGNFRVGEPSCTWFRLRWTDDCQFSHRLSISHASCVHLHLYIYGGFWNGGTPKSSMFIGFSFKSHPLWGTPFMETTISTWSLISRYPDRSYVVLSSSQGGRPRGAISWVEKAPHNPQ